MTAMDGTSSLRVEPPAPRAKREASAGHPPHAAPSTARATVHGSGAGAAERGWAWAGPLAVLAVFALLAIYWETAATLVGLWAGSSTFGHGFLIVPISLFLAWLRRDELLAVTPRPSVLGLAFTAAAAFAWLLGGLGSAQVIQQIALVAMIQGAIVSVIGLAAARVLWFPLLYLYFGVPIGLALVPPLQDWTAQFVVQMLRFTGIPVYLDGIFIHIPSGSFEVAEACAGVRFLISSVAIGAVFAYVMYRELWRRIVFVLLAIAVPIIANGFRAYGIVMLAHLSDYKIAAGADHITYGLIFLSIVFFLLLSLGLLLREREDAEGDTAPAADRSLTTVKPWWRFIVAGSVALSLAWGAHAYAEAIASRNGHVTAELAPPAASGAWRLEQDAAEAWRPRFPAADARLLETYTNDAGERVDLFIAYYARQREGAEVVQFNNDLIDTERWVRASGSSGRTAIGGTVLPVEQLRLIARGRQRIVWHWYWVDGRLTTNPYVAKLLEVKAKLLGTEQAAAAVAVSSEYVHEPEEAKERLARFLEAVDPLTPLKTPQR